LSSSLRAVVLGVMAALVVGMWVLTFVSKRFERVAAGVAALELRAFDHFTVIALGSGGAFENPARLGPAVGIAVGRTVVLVDAGRGVAEALRAAEVPAHQPSAVLLTSLLPENSVGLDDLWLTGWLGPREAPLRVYGPPGTRALVEGLRAAHEAGRGAQAEAWALAPEGATLEVYELEDGETLEIDALRVRVAALSGGLLPTLAYRIEAEGRSAVISSAGVDPERVVTLAQDADVLVAGAVYGASLEAAAEAGIERLDVLQREAAQHFRLEDLGALASRARVRTLLLVRLRPPPVFDFQYTRLVGETFRGRVVVARDGELVTP
jgi:ribonuclease BN (tRNA processing enzyme)